jgi:hypothetical protein
MNKLSSRHKLFSCRAGIETPSGGGSVGVSTAVRKYWREHFKGVAKMLGPNDNVNYLIALDYASATPIHRFILSSGEVGEIRKSHSFYYIAAIRKTKRHDIIVIQQSYKEAPEYVKKTRMTNEWIDEVFSGKAQYFPKR